MDWVPSLPGCEVRQIGGDGLAQDDGARSTKRGDARRIGSGPMSSIQRTAVLRGHVGGIDDVLDTHRNPVQRSFGGPVDLARLRKGALHVQELPRLDLRIALAD